MSGSTSSEFLIEVMVPGLPQECEMEYRVHLPFRLKVRSQPRSDPESSMPPPAPKKQRVTATEAEFEHAHIPVVVHAIPLDSRSQPAREPGEPSDLEAPAASQIIEEVISYEID